MHFVSYTLPLHGNTHGRACCDSAWETNAY